MNIYWNETGAKTGLSAQLKAGKTILVSLYNPGSKGSYIIRLKVGPQQLNIVNVNNSPVTGDVICGNTKDSSDCELIFSLDFQQSSNSYVKLVPVSSGGSAKVTVAKELTISQQIKDFVLGNDKLKITRGNQNFDLTLNGTTQTFNIVYNYYQGWVGGQSSGAYIFRPTKDTPTEYSSIKKIYYADATTTVAIVLQGDKTLTRVYFSKTVDYVRNFGFLIETFVDSIPIADKIGKEVTLNLKTKYNNGKIFYTDSMGLQEQKRILDYRPTWTYQVNEPTSGNYYPINSFIRIQDSSTNKSITVINDRSQGGTVMRSGDIELMIHRRLLNDDGRGVDQPLNETDADKEGLRQLVRHYVVFGNEYRAVQKWNDQRILPTFVASSSTTFASKAIRTAPISVPETVKLYLRPFEDGTYLLRLHNMHPSQSTSVTISDPWKATEYTLAANQLKSDWKKKQYSWNQEKTESKDDKSFVRQVTKLWTDLEETTSGAVKKIGNLVTFNADTSISLLPFEMKAFKISK